MTPPKSEFYPGQDVTYRPHPTAPTEPGKITRMADDGLHAFVKYATGTPKLTRLMDLRPTHDTPRPPMRTLIAPLTLGELLDHVATLPHDARLPFSSVWDSYRGYYDHVAFEPLVADDARPAASHMYKVITEAIGTTMHGYKGGQYPVTRDTAVFIAPYGETGSFLGLLDGEFVLMPERWNV